MIRHVYLDQKIYKKLLQLRRSGKKAALAAARAAEIISRLQSGGIIPGRVGTMTRHGELRIRGVMKYDLGSGYRMVIYKYRKRLFLLFVGTHDDCHRWIENNRELTVEQIQERCALLPVCTAETHSTTDADEAMSIEEVFDPLSASTERDLRQVFCGLVGGEP